MGSLDFGEESRIVLQICSPKISTENRKRFIAQLESLPVNTYPFYHRWLIVHNVQPFESWDENGFFPERSSFPREMQILWATSYGIEDIKNGGFHQFFWNPTGNFAPEMCECLDLLDLAAPAHVIREAMQFFGIGYPRSPEVRHVALDKYQAEAPQQPDPFERINDAFYESLGSDCRFDEAADQLLRVRFGKTTLSE